MSPKNAREVSKVGQKHVLLPSSGRRKADFVQRFHVFALYAAILAKMVLNGEVKS